MGWEVEYYEWNGKVYVKEFIDSLPNNECKAKILRAFLLLQEFWPNIGEPYVKSVEGYKGLWELRAQRGRIEMRVLFSPISDMKLLLLNGFIKKRSRIPPHELRIAFERLSEYKSRREKGQTKGI